MHTADVDLMASAILHDNPQGAFVDLASEYERPANACTYQPGIAESLQIFLRSVTV